MATIADLGIVVSTNGVAEANRQLDKLEEASAGAEAQARKLAPTFNNAATSARQLQAATRGLPMQFTDIVTSLASGQRPLQVLLQQGGQLKDIFGGVGPAARAMGSYLAGLINPVTLLGGAAAALAVAWKQASDEAEDFARALILVGEDGRTTVADMRRMAAEIDRETIATTGKASQVLAQVAATGRFTQDQIQQVARAAIEMEDATGRAIEDTIKDFIRLSEAPGAYAAELNETGVVQGFLTRETAKAIRELEQQGRTAEAAARTIDLYAGTIRDRSGEVIENLSTWSTLWRDIKSNAAGAFDTIRDGFRDSGASDLLANSVRSLLPLDWTKTSKPVREQIRVDLITGANLPASRAEIQAEEEWQRLVVRNLDRRAQMEREIAEARRLGVKAGASELEIERQIAAIRERYAEKGRKRVRERDPAAQLLERIRQQIALNEAERASGESLTASERLRVQVLQELAGAKGKITAARRTEIEAALAEMNISDRLLRQQREEIDLQKQLDQITREREEEINRDVESTAQLLDDMRFELALMRMSNEERAREIALRHAAKNATDGQRAAVAELAVAIERQGAVVSVMDDFRGMATDLLVGLPERGKDAWRDFLGDLERMLRRLAVKLQ